MASSVNLFHCSYVLEQRSTWMKRSVKCFSYSDFLSWRSFIELRHYTAIWENDCMRKLAAPGPREWVKIGERQYSPACLHAKRSSTRKEAGCKSKGSFALISFHWVGGGGGSSQNAGIYLLQPLLPIPSRCGDAIRDVPPRERTEPSHDTGGLDPCWSDSLHLSILNNTDFCWRPGEILIWLSGGFKWPKWLSRTARFEKHWAKLGNFMTDGHFQTWGRETKGTWESG